MKKVFQKLQVLMTVLIVCLALATQAAAANGSVTIQCEKKEVKPGDRFEVSVYAEDIDNLAGFFDLCLL